MGNKRFMRHEITTFDKDMMQRAIALAMRGSGAVAPNPLVGCVIVHEGKVIGEGFHERFGEAHAEVNAINAVADKSLLHESSLYVTLEPCSHFGKTPPCADLIVRMGIPRVFIGSRDPFESVNGRGVERLRAAGIEVIEGVEEAACRDMNRRFLCFHEKQRPYILLKWAQTADGLMDIDRHSGEKGVRWITGPETKRFVHELRAKEAAVMVGRNTVLNDNPQLTVREAQGKDPVRVVLSSVVDFPEGTHVLDGQSPTLILNNEQTSAWPNCRLVQCANVHDVQEVVSKLYRERLLSVLIEGGATVLNAFLCAGLWDEAIVITGPESWKSGMVAPKIDAPCLEERPSGWDVIRYYRRTS